MPSHQSDRMRCATHAETAVSFGCGKTEHCDGKLSMLTRTAILLQGFEASGGKLGLGTNGGRLLKSVGSLGGASSTSAPTHGKYSVTVICSTIAHSAKG
eukprot:2281298-Amphidinium_carterae.1